MDKSNNDFDQILLEVAKYFGGMPKLAHALGIDRHAIYQWKKIPPGRAYQIEVLTQGKFTANLLLKHRKNYFETP